MALRHVTPLKQSEISRIKYSVLRRGEGGGGEKGVGGASGKQANVLVSPQGEFFFSRNVNED